MQSDTSNQKIVDIVKQTVNKFLLDSIWEIELVPINNYNTSNRKKYHLKFKSIKPDKTGTKEPLIYPIAK